MQLDHIILAASARGSDTPRLPSAYDLEASAGGRHPAWGTANWIIPLGDSYLELIAVVDEGMSREATTSAADPRRERGRPDRLGGPARRHRRHGGPPRPERRRRIANASIRRAHRVAHGRSRGSRSSGRGCRSSSRGATRPPSPERLGASCARDGTRDRVRHRRSCRPGSGLIRSHSTSDPETGA